MPGRDLTHSLDILPPVPTLVNGQNSLHTFLGYSLAQHVVSITARDPADGREMPPNGNAHVSAYTLRGVRKVCLRPQISGEGLILNNV